jgi:Kelch motif
MLAHIFVGSCLSIQLRLLQVHGKIYVVGGRNNSPDEGNVDSPAMDCLDPVANVWTRCADMTAPRNRVGVASLDCMVYAVGGSKEREFHKSVER